MKNKLGKAQARMWKQINFGNATGVRRALEAGADPNLRNAEGLLALSEACRMGMTEVALVLLSRNADATAVQAFITEDGCCSTITPMAIVFAGMVQIGPIVDGRLMMALVARGANPYSGVGPMKPDGTPILMIDALRHYFGGGYAKEIEEAYAMGQRDRQRAAMVDAISNEGLKSTGRIM
jgi:hypothetical protein